MHIRFATEDDASDIHSIMMDAYAEYRLVPGSSSALSETADGIRDGIQSGYEHILLGFLDRGLAVASVRYRIEGGLYFYRLSVRRVWQGHGFAKELMTHLETLAIAAGQPQMWCQVRYSVARNVHLYESLGFKKSGQDLVHKKGGVTLEGSLDDEQGIADVLRMKPNRVPQRCPIMCFRLRQSTRRWNARRPSA
jgi:GNAT superfamily N-acetyltransferase